MNNVLRIESSGLGDTLCATPILRKMHQVYGSKISVCTHCPEIFENNPLVDRIWDLKESVPSFKSFPDKYLVHRIFIPESCIGEVELKHNRMHIVQYNAVYMGIQLLPDECHLDFYPNVSKNSEIQFEKYVVIHPSVTWASRTWDRDKWQDLIYRLNKNGIPVVVIGKEFKHFSNDGEKIVFDMKVPFGVDMSNRTDLSQTWNIINNAEAIVTMDSGMLHLAGTTDTHIIQLGSSIHPLFRAPYRNGSQDYKYRYVSGPCDIHCASKLVYGLKEHGSIHGIPPLEGCLENKLEFECHPSVDLVYDNIKSLIGDEEVVPVSGVIADSKKKVLYIAPHLSTGGMPEVLRKRIELLIDVFDIYVVEFTCYGTSFVVQRDKIIELIGEDNFFSLGGLSDGENYILNRMKLMDIIRDVNPIAVHIDGTPEQFFYGGFPDKLAEEFYSDDREYVIFETSHDSSFLPDEHKKWFPDKFLFVSPWHMEIYKNIDVPKSVVEYPIEIKERPDRDKMLKKMGLDPSFKHVINVGLFTPNKNQKEIFDISELMKDDKVVFHFVGNMAHNFKSYWEPLMKDTFIKCNIWGERADVDKFYSCMDLFLFPSLYELNPIVLKEALGWQMPVLLRNLKPYCGMYDDNDNVHYLSDDIVNNVSKIRKILEKK